MRVARAGEPRDLVSGRHGKPAVMSLGSVRAIGVVRG
jgi:hypothetical protein